MLNLPKKLISQAIFVIGFDRDLTVRTRQFEIEKAMTSLVNAPSVNTNIPDDFNPQAPRVTMSGGDISVQFSQITAQLTINVDNSNAKPIEVITESITKRINLFQSILDKVIGIDKQLERGMVLVVSYPVDLDKTADEELAEYIASSFTKVQSFGKPQNVGINVAYKTDDNYFITLTVAQYKQAISDLVGTQSQFIDFAKLPVTEKGIELKIDINSRPLLASANTPKDVTKIVLDKSFDFLLNQADNFMGMKK